jgi:hypothetical protein
MAATAPSPSGVRVGRRVSGGGEAGLDTHGAGAVDLAGKPTAATARRVPI